MAGLRERRWQRKSCRRRVSHTQSQTACSLRPALQPESASGAESKGRGARRSGAWRSGQLWRVAEWRADCERDGGGGGSTAVAGEAGS